APKPARPTKPLLPTRHVEEESPPLLVVRPPGRASPVAGSWRTPQHQARGHGSLHPAAHQRHHARFDLRSHCHRLHDGVRHHRHGEFRPWRRVHGVGLHCARYAAASDHLARHRLPPRLALLLVARLSVLPPPLLPPSLVTGGRAPIPSRPLRRSFRLAPLISAIGMPIFLSNFVQVARGPRVKSTPPFFNEVIVLMSG